MNRLAFILIALCISAAPVSLSTSVQKQLDAMPKSGGTVNADRAFGGTVVIAPGEHTWTKGITISSAQTIDGLDAATTLIIYNGPPGTAAITINSYTGNHYVHRPRIRNLQIRCAPGTNAISIDPTAQWVEGLEVSNVITNGPILLGGENYACVLDGVKMIANNRQALLLSGQCHVLRGVKVQGTVGADAAKIPAVVELHGSATFEGFSWLEGSFACPTISFNDWQGWHGEFNVGPTWEEAHVDGTFALVSNATVTTPMTGGTEKWNWLLEKGGQIRTQRLPHSPGTVVSPDGTGKLVVNGAEQTVK